MRSLRCVGSGRPRCSINRYVSFSLILETLLLTLPWNRGPFVYSLRFFNELWACLA